VHGSDHEGILSLLESVLSSESDPINDVHCAQNKTSETCWQCEVWSAPSYPEMFHGIPHKNIILGEYLHSTHYSENLKQNLQ
jgi:hypothetical protein